MIQTRGKVTFPGGVHPQENKHFTEDCPIEQFPTPKTLSILLGQHIGAMCRPLVAKRDKVTAGQVIGDADAFVSAPVHSPVDGTVKDIALASHPVLGRAMAITIETDPESENHKQPCPQKFDKDFDATRWTAGEIREAIRQGGIVGMGGAGFPTRVKLEPNPQMPKEIMIINGCECEPFITCDYRLMLEWSLQIIAGIKLACRAAECYDVRIGIEDNKPEAIKAMTAAIEACSGTEKMQVVPVRTKYPQGGEKQLIKAIWKKDVPVGGIPPGQLLRARGNGGRRPHRALRRNERQDRQGHHGRTDDGLCRCRHVHPAYQDQRRDHPAYQRRNHPGQVRPAPDALHPVRAMPRCLPGTYKPDENRPCGKTRPARRRRTVPHGRLHRVRLLQLYLSGEYRTDRLYQDRKDTRRTCKKENATIAGARHVVPVQKSSVFSIQGLGRRTVS